MVKQDKHDGQVLLHVSLTVTQIYKKLCPKCKETLLNLAVQSLAVQSLAAQTKAADSIKSQLKEQWEKK